MSRRKHAIRRDAGRHLTDRQREILGRVWNQYVNRLVPVSLREFAKLHNVPHETWRREYRRGAAPTVSASGQMVQADAAQLRKYVLPTFSLTPRHRAQDFIGLCEIKKGAATADASEDYGLESVEANFPIEFTLAQPKGEVVNYDLHGGMATCSFAMNWYAATAPTVSLTSAATALGASISSPVAKSCPEGGYVQYTWTVSFPLVGEEVASS